MSSQDGPPRSYSKETGSRDGNDEDPNTLASEHTCAKGSLLAQAKPIIAKDLHSLSIPAAAKYFVNTHRFLPVQEISVWHRQFLKNKQRNDERSGAPFEKASRAILYIKSPSLSNKVRK